MLLPSCATIHRVASSHLRAFDTLKQEDICSVIFIISPYSKHCTNVYPTHPDWPYAACMQDYQFTCALFTPFPLGMRHRWLRSSSPHRMHISIYDLIKFPISIGSFRPPSNPMPNNNTSAPNESAAHTAYKTCRIFCNVHK